MEIKVKTIISTIVSALSILLHRYGIIFGLLIAIMVMDTLVGMIDSKYQGQTLSNEKAFKGFLKKLSYIIGMFFGVFIDGFVPVIFQLGLGVSFNTHGSIGLFISVYIIINECISVSKHLHNISNGIIPDFVDDFFSKIVTLISKGGEQ